LGCADAVSSTALRVLIVERGVGGCQEGHRDDATYGAFQTDPVGGIGL
jgi:hypothetical protein